MKAISRLAGMAVATVFLLASCAKNDSNVLSTIPADITFVAKIDLTKENAKELANAFFGDIKIDEEKDILDLKNVVMTRNEKNVVITSIPVKDEGAFAKILVEDGLKETDNPELKGSKAFESDDMCVVIKDGIARLGAYTVKVISAEIKDNEKAEKTIADCSGVVEALNADHMLNIVLSTKIADNDKPSYLVAGIDMDKKLSSAFSNIYADGAIVESPVLQPVSADVMDYLPSNVIAAFTLGINGDKLDNNIIKEINSELHKDIAAVGTVIWDYLKRLSGTTMVAVTLNDPSKTVNELFDEPFDALGYMAMVQMSQDSLDLTLKEIKTLMGVIGTSYSDAGNGFYVANVGLTKLWFGVVNDYLLLSTFKPEKQATPPFKQPSEVDSWLWVNLKNLNLPDGHKLGLQASGQYSHGKGTFEAYFSGSGESFIEGLKKLVFLKDSEPATDN